MKKRIDNPALITPAYEDGGLFKKPPTELVVHLIPKFGKNTRGDVIIAGLVQKDVQIAVIFAGRRKRQADDLVSLLKRKWSNANYRLPKGTPPPERSDVRVAIRVEGSWRTRILEDDENWYERQYQLLVARWTYKSDSGEARSFGEPPVSEKTRRPKRAASRD